MMNGLLTGLLVWLAATPFMEAKHWKGGKAGWDIVVFACLWLLATAAIIALLSGWPLPRPLDWIKVATSWIGG